jgi:phosphopantetheinyl transferase
MAAVPLARIVEQFPSLHHVAVSAQPTDALEAALSLGLPPHRLEAIRRQQRPEDRLQRLVASALVYAAARHAGSVLRPSEVSYPVDGPPSWPDGAYCSVSHADGHVVVLVGRQAPVGVDVEVTGSASPEDLRLVLPHGLRDAVMDGRLDATDAWMRVEAALKAVGAGLRGLEALHFPTPLQAQWGGRRIFLQPAPLAKDQRCWCAQTIPWVDPDVRITRHTVESLVQLLAAAQPSRIAAP